MGSEGGGGLVRAVAIPFKHLASWEVQEDGFFPETWSAMCGHVSSFRSVGGGGGAVDLIDADVDERSVGGRSDGGCSDGGCTDGGRGSRKQPAGKDGPPHPSPKKVP